MLARTGLDPSESRRQAGWHNCAQCTRGERPQKVRSPSRTRAHVDAMLTGRPFAPVRCASTSPRGRHGSRLAPCQSACARRSTNTAPSAVLQRAGQRTKVRQPGSPAALTDEGHGPPPMASTCRPRRCPAQHHPQELSRRARPCRRLRPSPPALCTCNDGLPAASHGTGRRARHDMDHVDAACSRPAIAPA